MLELHPSSFSSMAEQSDDPIRAMLEQTRRTPRLTFYRSTTAQSPPLTEQSDAVVDSYCLFLTSVFLMAERDNPAEQFLGYRSIYFSAEQAIGEPTIEGEVKNLSCVQGNNGQPELRIILENGLQLQYVSPGIPREVSGSPLFELYSA